MRTPLLAVVLCCLAGGKALALGPEDVWILVNRNVPRSREVAEYYCAKRGVPRDHVVALDMTANEDVGRSSYEDNIARPLRKLLSGKKEKVKVLVTTFGVPLRVGSDEPTAEEKAELAKVQATLAEQYKKREALSARLKELEPRAKANPKGEDADALGKARAEMNALAAGIRFQESRKNWLSHAEAGAAVDSELSMLWQDRYELRRWQPNPLYFRVAEEARAKLPPMLMTARLDGPTLAVIKGLVDQALEAERKGLKGKVYVDAQGKKFDLKVDPTGQGYDGYDESLREFAVLYRPSRLPVVVEDTVKLFGPGECPECALYCGWYSHGKYIDSFTFVPGAVGYHIASSEAVSLHDPKATYWCKRMLDKGITATLGPVSEPYTLGFPKPAEFFGLLGTGKYTLVESYWMGLRHTSWMMVLVGDPLYNPFAGRAAVKPEDVKPSPAGSR